MNFGKTIKSNLYTALLLRFLMLMLLYTFCRVGFYAINSDLFNEINPSRFFIMIRGGLQFDLAALLYLNLIYILLQIIPFPFRFRDAYQWFCKWLFILTNSIGLAANFIDFAYYRFTLKRTTATVFKQFSNEQNKLKLGLDFMADYWYLLLGFLLLIWLMAKLYNKIEVKKEHFKWTYLLKDVALMVLIMGITVVGIRGGWRHSTRPITLSNAAEYVEDPSETSIVLNTPFSIIRTLRITALEPRNDFDEQTLNNIYSPIHRPKNKAPFDKQNVVILIIESLGKEHVGSLNTDLENGKYKGYTPFIDSLISQGLTFSTTIANGRKSIDGLPSVLSSIPSVNEPFILTPYSSNEINSLPKILKTEGYTTAFFHGAPNGSMGFSAYTKMAGIDQYFGKTEYGNDADFDGMWGIWDEPFLQFMADKMGDLKQPFITTFFSTSSHHPFKVPEQYKGKFPKGPLEVQEPLGYTDMSLRKFFESAKKQPWYKNTLFVLTADHATLAHFPAYKNAMGNYAVPIVLYHPERNLKGKLDKIVQQIDILPTVLSYLNYDKPYFSFGFDALDPDADNFAVNNNEGTYRFYYQDFVLFNDGKKNLALYNFKKDRLLKQNLLGTVPRQSKMEEKLKAFIQQYNNRMINNQLIVKP